MPPTHVPFTCEFPRRPRPALRADTPPRSRRHTCSGCASPGPEPARCSSRRCKSCWLGTRTSTGGRRPQTWCGCGCRGTPARFQCSSPHLLLQLERRKSKLKQPLKCPSSKWGLQQGLKPGAAAWGAPGGVGAACPPRPLLSFKCFRSGWSAVPSGASPHHHWAALRETLRDIQVQERLSSSASGD